MPDLRHHAAPAGASPQTPQPFGGRCGTEFNHLVLCLPRTNTSAQLTGSLSFWRQLKERIPPPFDSEQRMRSDTKPKRSPSADPHIANGFSPIPRASLVPSRRCVSIPREGRVVGVLLNVAAIPEAFILPVRFRCSSLISSQLSANSLAFGTRGNGRILGRFALWASHRSYCICILTQNSGDVPGAAESLSDINAEIPACPFRIRERCALVTPRRSAASATLISPR